ncbi:MAG: putative peptidoglycan lipid flippase, partial [Gaiellaceae bacterium]|nr:putative peptidoglycan lipid flippase [Gaiellaceae bacterium]
MSDAERERELRRLERDRRRRERGRPTFFEEQRELTPAGPEDPTRTMRVEELQAIDGVETEQFTPAEQVMPPADPQLDSRRRLGVSTAIFGAATALSRLLGLAREMVASYYFGVKGPINAFTIAFQFPNLVRALVADAALSSAFVPVFVDLLKEDRKRAWRVASSLFWLMLLGLTALSALFVVVAPWLVGVFGDPGHNRA